MRAIRKTGTRVAVSGPIESPGMVMGTTSRRALGYDEAALVVCAALGSAALVVPELAVWPPKPTTLAFCALTLLSVAIAALSTSSLHGPASRHDDWTTVRPSFVIDFAVLLLLGP